MKKLTAGIFAAILTVVGVSGANAEIASKGYVDAVQTNLTGHINDATANFATKQQLTDTIGGLVETTTGDGNVITAIDQVAGKVTATKGITAATSAELATVSDDVSTLKTDVANLKTATGEGTGSVLDTAKKYTDSKVATEVTDRNKAIADADTALESKITAAYGTAITGAVQDLDAAVSAGEDKIAYGVTEVDGKLTSVQSKYTIANEGTDLDADGVDKDAYVPTVSAVQILLDNGIGLDIASLEGAIDNEVVAREALAGTVAANKNAAEKAVSDLTSAVNTKDNALTAEDTRLAGLIATEKSERTAKDAALTTAVEAAQEAAEAAASGANTTIGQLTSLTTTAKGTVVAAINEVDANADAAQAKANTNATNLNTMGTQVNTQLAKVLQNPGECAKPGNKCVLTIDTKGLGWEVVERATGETVTANSAQAALTVTVPAK